MYCLAWSEYIARKVILLSWSYRAILYNNNTLITISRWQHTNMVSPSESTPFELSKSCKIHEMLVWEKVINIWSTSYRELKQSDFIFFSKHIPCWTDSHFARWLLYVSTGTLYWELQMLERDDLLLVGAENSSWTWSCLQVMMMMKHKKASEEQDQSL